ncbi:hypothetical protein [Candidatus Methylacidithermus pantelleriae]|uniref:hypothetical protein n=1 Tax=Candidatus Methylacidithermus pantelleriae TaxID=2744239 RepID=UPI00157C867D|nr:hypothetical protein [Candidatus Methylacidithermus pantelleriae]
MPQDSSARSSTKRICWVLTLSPFQRDFTSFLEQLRKTLGDGHRVFVYCLDEGVRAGEILVEEAKRWPGLRIAVCAYGASRRRLPPQPGVLYAGLGTLAQWILSTEECRADGGDAERGQQRV